MKSQETRQTVKVLSRNYYFAQKDLKATIFIGGIKTRIETGNRKIKKPTFQQVFHIYLINPQ